jgi:uncharacterized delta-60 repeat protein
VRIKCIFIVLCICFFSSSIVLYADDYYIQWADTIDNGDYDCAHGVAIDNANNIIVTGYCGVTGIDYDYFTVKYDSNGTILWTDTIDNGGSYDIARSVAVDNTNNIIVTGYCDIGGYCDYFTVKYDPNGTILWADTIANDRHDTALDVVVDNANNIIVTGYCVMAGPNCDYFTVKYDPNGTILWQDIIDNRTFDYAHGVAVDNFNNIIVTGTTGEPGSLANYNYFTVKYDSNGTILWTDTTGSNGAAHGVATDNANNIIVTGGAGISGSDDYFTVKYDPNGTILWTDTIDNGDSDIARGGVAVDNANNIIITGYSRISGSDDYFTVKYDSDGTILWQDTINNGDYDCAYGVAVDNANNIIITGGSYIGLDCDYFTVKYVPLTGVSEDEGSDLLSNNPILYNIYPNPVVGEAMKITYCLVNANEVKIKVYDISGSLVCVLENKPKASGYYTIIWDGIDYGGKTVSSGVYFLKFETGDYNETKKILFIK